ncbi:MAG TPA: YCF48-related protein [Pyrinomonadaceae bacterium]|nr:YCF48-related protein [Pyrinomonadaceae bacterium]
MRATALVTCSWGLDMRQKIVVHTSDGGQTWKKQLDLENSYSSIFFLNQEEGWLVGDAVVHTNDGGQTWKIKTPDDFGYSLQKAIFADNLRGWAIGQGRNRTPSLLATFDAGRTWTVISNGWKQKITKSRLPAIALQ